MGPRGRTPHPGRTARLAGGGLWPGNEEEEFALLPPLAVAAAAALSRTTADRVRFPHSTRRGSPHVPEPRRITTGNRRQSAVVRNQGPSHTARGRATPALLVLIAFGHAPTPTPSARPLLGLTLELLRVSAAIAALSGLYYAIAVLTDATYRGEFLEELTAEMRATFVDRVEYLALRATVSR
jgi:hypothetical protein